MPKFIIDANLPYYFKLWNSDEYIHQFDLNPKASDKSIWTYAKERNLTIVNTFWNEVLDMNESHKLVNVYEDRIEGIK